MDVGAPRGLLRFFQDLPDPRAANARHRLVDIMAIALMAVLSKAQDWIEVEAWGLANELWLATFLDLPHGIPSHDTFSRVFARLAPQTFEGVFRAWMNALQKASDGQLIAIDGKTLRRSFQVAGAKSAVHMVSAWAPLNHVVLGQLATEAKSNEITAIPKLLKLLDLKGATVTIDAMGCQKEIARQIVKAGGHYLLAIKDNQPTLHEGVKFLFDEAIAHGFESLARALHQEVEADHGRMETRRCWSTREVAWFQDRAQWEGLGSFVCVECAREVMGGQTSTERRYYISSHNGQDAAFLAQAVRAHWGIENRLHWCLDMCFQEDQCRVRQGHGAQNLSRLRRIALNLLRRNQTRKGSLKTKRFLCSCDRQFLLDVLLGLT